MVKHLKTNKWVKGEHDVSMYYGNNYIYAYSKVRDKWMLMVSTKIGDIRYTMRIKKPYNRKTNCKTIRIIGD